MAESRQTIINNEIQEFITIFTNYWNLVRDLQHDTENEITFINTVMPLKITITRTAVRGGFNVRKQISVSKLAENEEEFLF